MSTAWARIKRLSWSSMRLTYAHPEDFVLQRWQTSARVDGHYVLFRILILLLLSAQIHVGTRFSSGGPWLPFIYFTHWTFIAMAAYALAHLVVVVVAYAHQQALALQDADAEGATSKPAQLAEVRWLNQLTLALANVSHNCATGVTLCFWSACWTQEAHDLTWITLLFHTWLSVLLVCNFMVISIPMRVEHAYLPLGFALIYCLLSVGYHFAGGVDYKGRRYIYKLMDWNVRPVIAAAVMIFALCLVLVVQILLFLLDYVKIWIYGKYLRRGLPHDLAGPAPEDERGFGMY